MAMLSTPKKRKFDASEESSDSGIDLISNLPDDLRLQILSFLPTKSAIATSILSTKWKNLFPLIPSLNLDFEDYQAGDPCKARSFISFVDRVFGIILRDVPSINSLRLRCHPNYEGDCIRWLRAATWLKLQRLDFRFSPMGNSKELLSTILGCQTLLYLSFGCCVITIPRCGVSLPNLKELLLQTPVFSSTGAFQRLLRGCPVLERLILNDCRSQSVKYLPTCIPSLKYLAVMVDFRYCTDVAFEIMLDTPNLETLTWSGCIIECCEGKKLDSLRRAVINSPNIDWNDLEPTKKFQRKLEEFIMACPNLESLEHSMDLYHSNPPLLPPLYNLKRLELSGMGSHGWKKLPGMLERAPNLESLSIGGVFNEISYEIFSRYLPEVLPKCFLHLKQVCFSSLHGEEYDIRLFEYFLQKAVVLEKMKIMVNIPSWGLREDMNFIDNVSTLPRHSMTCKISFEMHWWNLEGSPLDRIIFDEELGST